MNETLPRGMVARLTQVATEWVAWAERHPQATLADQEAAVLGVVRHALPDLLAALLPLCTRELRLPGAGQRQCCPRCSTTCGVQEWRPRTVATVCGPVHFERPWYRCRGCGES